MYRPDHAGTDRINPDQGKNKNVILYNKNVYLGCLFRYIGIRNKKGNDYE